MHGGCFVGIHVFVNLENKKVKFNLILINSILHRVSLSIDLKNKNLHPTRPFYTANSVCSRFGEIKVINNGTNNCNGGRSNERKERGREKKRKKRMYLTVQSEVQVNFSASLTKHTLHTEL